MSIGVMVNHAISFATSPLAVSLALMTAGAVVLLARRAAASAKPSRIGLVLIGAGLVWLWIMSSGLTNRVLGLGLERTFPPQRVEELPSADAIVLLSGGMGGNTNTVCYPELYPSADRVAHAARLWKAGKAPVILASGTNELVATMPFLLELGVPRAAIRVENEAGNTEENARFVARVLAQERSLDDASSATTTASRSERPKVLLVTSSWHMRRALLMFRKYAPELEVVPAACDYEATVYSDEFHFWESLLPGAESLFRNSCMLKEHIGYWGYRLLR